MDVRQEVTRLKVRLEQVEAAGAEIRLALRRKLQEDWIHHCHVLEGGSFTYRETVGFLREGLTVHGRTLREHQEIANRAAMIRGWDEVLKMDGLTEESLLDLHARLYEGISGLPFRPGACTSAHASAEVRALLERCREAQGRRHPVDTAAELHLGLMRLHPFPEGNGPVARLCMNWILEKEGYPSAVIRTEGRTEYVMALGQEDPRYLAGLIGQEVRQSLALQVLFAGGGMEDVTTEASR
ncbi:Fic family protein [Paenibacillus mucilaginosus]|uniref:Fic family protein n=1 Tax=Paenibacillus mucilaginosus TaxID=61624 RepID=UPI0002ED597B|nr:Fic family protein [Paenibacillus mucilaginosus]MCG7215280.1 Fic family protein [Paenibacillus mucilaginosus]WDM26945.1 Fic family protein [Paenibacillus mucilaginosus]